LLDTSGQTSYLAPQHNGFKAEKDMRNAALAGAIALAVIGNFSISSQGVSINSAMAQDIVVTHSQISRLKHALRMTGAQEAKWRPVEQALRALVQRPYRVASADASFVERAHARVSGYTLDAMAMSSLRSAAGPLIEALSDEQRQAGRAVLSSMGISF
jgi:hypothetical protein